MFEWVERPTMTVCSKQFEIVDDRFSLVLLVLADLIL